MYTKHFSLPQSSPPKKSPRTTTKNAFLPSTVLSWNLSSGCLKANVKTFVWRAPESIGFLFPTSWRTASRLPSQIRNGFLLLRVTRMMSRIPSGLVTCSGLVWCQTALFHQRRYGFCGSMRYRFKLVSCKSSEKNRFQNTFTVCNVALDAVVSDMFGKSASAITDYLVNCETFDPDHCISLLQKSLKKKADEVLDSIQGYQMTEAQKERIRMTVSYTHL